MDPLTIPTGAVAFIGVTYTSSRALFKAVQSYLAHRADARRLSKELEVLQGMLTRLGTCARQSSDTSVFEALEAPLTQCARGCDDVRRLVEECTRHGGGIDGGPSKRSIRDWAKMRYKDREIRQFVDEIGAYKDIIGITLAGVTLQKAELTLDCAQRFDDHLVRAEGYFETLIEQISDQLERLNDLTVSVSSLGRDSTFASSLSIASANGQDNQAPSDAPGTTVALAPDDDYTLARDITLFEQELASAEACLGICDRYRAQIARTRFEEMRIQLPPAPAALPNGNSSNDSSANNSGSISLRSSSSANTVAADSMSTAATSTSLSSNTPKSQDTLLSALKHADDTFTSATAQIQSHKQATATALEEVRTRYNSSTRAAPSQDDESLAEQRHQLTTELNAMKQCRVVCAEVQVLNTNRVKNMSVGQGGRQLLLTQFDQLWDVENVTAGDGALQAVGCMSDEAILALVGSRKSSAGE